MKRVTSLVDETQNAKMTSLHDLGCKRGVGLREISSRGDGETVRYYFRTGRFRGWETSGDLGVLLNNEQ
jgi:hypothetical protein